MLIRRMVVRFGIWIDVDVSRLPVNTEKGGSENVVKSPTLSS
jgi:hypothetical protein